MHLWQPSGNRPNKPKMVGEKRRKGTINRKRDQTMNNNQKRVIRKKKNELTTPLKATPPTNMLPEQQSTLPFHNSAACEYY